MTTKPKETRKIAAIDLGSNSFHMVVAKVVGQELQLISRHKQRVSLASGLDDSLNLDEAAIARGLECLTMFSERLQGFSQKDVSVAATNTLRIAKNANAFLQRAKQVLPFPIETIPGTEEARLVYLGVAHTQPESDSKLVIDIGGGSTELIVGRGFEAQLIHSLQMGCVSYTKAFFADGNLSKRTFSQAVLAAEQKLKSIASQYRQSDWDVAFGSSGTIKSISEVLRGMGHHNGVITQSGLSELVDKLCSFSRIEHIKLEKLSPERQPVFAAGLAVLQAVFNALDIDQMHFSEGALREGLLYQMEDTFQRSDIRLRTTEALAQKYNVDLKHAARVRTHAYEFLDQISTQIELKKNTELHELLGWSALLHEVGLGINLQSVHKHSSYILLHSNLPGFNTEQQKVISTLVRFHRKSLKLSNLDELSLYETEHILSLIRILRLAIVVNSQRNNDDLPPLQLHTEHGKWVLSSTHKDWLDSNKLLNADLATEQAYWEAAGWELEIN